MPIEQIVVQRFSVTSSNSFEHVLENLHAAVGHPDMREFMRDVAAASTYADLESVIHKAVGVSGLMELIRFDLGEIVRKERGARAPPGGGQSAHHEANARSCARLQVPTRR